MDAKLDLETFSQVMDDFLTKNECQILVTLPKGTQKAAIESNVKLGPVGNIYMMLQAIHSSCGELFKMVEAGDDAREAMSAAICKMLYESLTEDE